MLLALLALGWLLVGVFVTYINLRKPETVIQVEERIIHPPPVIEPEIPQDIKELAELAGPLVERFDGDKQSGEWKHHQVYALMLKHKAMRGVPHWKAGLAIELAVANRRLDAVESA